jgi:Secretion system C-terminal sorting domain
MISLFKEAKNWLLLSFLCAISTYSQDILWEKSFGGKNSEYLFDAIPTPDYGFILAGSSISGKEGSKSNENKGNYDYWVWKMTEKGDLDWQKSFGGSADDHLQSIRLTNDGGFILAGISNSPKDGDKNEDSKGQSDFWLIKLDAKGGEIWQQTIGGNGLENLYSISPTSDGGYIIGGTSSSDKSPKNESGKEDKFGKTDASFGNLDYWVIKLNSLGNIIWQKTYGGIYADELRSIEPTKDGGYIIGGYSNSPKSGNKTDDNFGEGDYWILKLDTTGEILWQKTIGGDQDDNLFVLTQTLDGGFIAGGSSNSGAMNSKTKGNGKGTDFWILKFDENGGIIWQETYDYGKLDVLTSIVENQDGTFLIGGYAQSEAPNTAALENGIVGKLPKAGDKEGINDYIALKINPNGEELWTQTVGSRGDEILRKLVETRDGGYILAGTSDGGASRDKKSSQGGNDFWVVKLKDKSKKEKEKLLLEVIPNPAISYTNVIVNYDYDYGTATLFDLNGRILKSKAINGEHTIPIELTNIPQGVYIIKVKTNNGEHAAKIIKR